MIIWFYRYAKIIALIVLHLKYWIERYIHQVKHLRQHKPIFQIKKNMDIWRQTDRHKKQFLISMWSTFCWFCAYFPDISGLKFKVLILKRHIWLLIIFDKILVILMITSGKKNLFSGEVIVIIWSLSECDFICTEKVTTLCME